MERNKRKGTEYTTETGIEGNREHKDTLFRKIFGAKEHRNYLLSLYNALNDSDYSNVEDLELTTMEDVLFVSMKNDVSFLLDCEMNLYEHQSTQNPNMPLRGLMYTAKLWQTWIQENQKNIYSRKLVKIPTPRYTVFYNGTETTEDKYELHLSDAFEHEPKDGIYEWTAIVYNINIGKNVDLMKKCRALREYADFVRMVRENYQKSKDETEAIKQAMEEAVRKNYLEGYFEKERDEVFMTTLFEVKKDIYENDLREEGRLEGRREGRLEGRLEGRQEGKTEERKEIIKLMSEGGMSNEQIGNMLKMPISIIVEILKK